MEVALGGAGQSADGRSDGAQDQDRQGCRSYFTTGSTTALGIFGAR